MPFQIAPALSDPLSYRLEVVFNLARCCEVFFLNQVNILQLCALVVFCSLSGLFLLVSWSVHSVFLTMHQTVDLAALKVFAGLLIGLFWGFFPANGESSALSWEQK